MCDFDGMPSQPCPPPVEPTRNRFIKLTPAVHVIDYKALKTPRYKIDTDNGVRVYNPLTYLSNKEIDRAVDIQEIADNAGEALDAIKYLKETIEEIKQNQEAFMIATERKIMEMERSHENQLANLESMIEEAGNSYD